VLASEEDGSAFYALQISPVGDVAGVAVLTADRAFLQTLRGAVGGARRLWHVPSADKLSDLLVAGGVGIVVLDLQTLHESARVFVEQIKRQFPDLVLVAAGHRDDEILLAASISSGVVYRFIHKPMSPGRAQLFAAAAIRKYEDQRRRAAETPPRDPASPDHGAWLIGSALVALLIVAAIAWMANRNNGEEAALPAISETAKPPAVESLALARAETALLEDRLDEAEAAIETARKSGIEGGRIAFLSAQLAKSRERIRIALARTREQSRPRTGPKTEEDRVTPLLTLAAQRIAEGRLLEPGRDGARYYVQEALHADPQNPAALDARRVLAAKLLEDAHGALDQRDFERALAAIEGADGIASPADIEAARTLLAAARRQADADARSQLLRYANERLLQDRLLEPANDNAKYFFMTLKQLDPGNPALASVQQDLGTRLTGKARRALILGQLDAAKSWLEEAGSVGFSSAETSSAQRDLDAAVAKQTFMTTLIPANQLTVLKSVQPPYPMKALNGKIAGWVDVEFTVTATGKVVDVSVRGASTPGVFEDAAVKAVSQWRYKPVLSDARPVTVRSQIRIRFTLP